jgi:hypothetical protein
MEENILGKAVFSDTVCATDPCYSRGTWCGEFDLKVKPGVYVGKTLTKEMGSWGHRNWRLSATKEDEEVKTWKFVNLLGVDAGTMSIYNSKHYDELNGSGWSDRTSDDHGFVVSSGLGDGSYHLFAGQNEEGETVALSVVFLFPKRINDWLEEEDGAPFSDERFLPFAGCPLEGFNEEEE